MNYFNALIASAFPQEKKLKKCLNILLKYLLRYAFLCDLSLVIHRQFVEIFESPLMRFNPGPSSRRIIKIKIVPLIPGIKMVEAQILRIPDMALAQQKFLLKSGDESLKVTAKKALWDAIKVNSKCHASTQVRL
jgi:hypothetical protein